MDKALRQRLKTAYNALEDRPLEPDDPYYVPFREQGDDDPIADLGVAIAFAPSNSVHLVSGQRGNGKSTELRAACAASCRTRKMPTSTCATCATT